LPPNLPRKGFHQRQCMASFREPPARQVLRAFFFLSLPSYECCFRASWSKSWAAPIWFFSPNNVFMGTRRIAPFPFFFPFRDSKCLDKVPSILLSGRRAVSLFFSLLFPSLTDSQTIKNHTPPFLHIHRQPFLSFLFFLFHSGKRFNWTIYGPLPLSTPEKSLRLLPPPQTSAKSTFFPSSSSPRRILVFPLKQAWILAPKSTHGGISPLFFSQKKYRRIPFP